jgi:O-acetyl-ADP-ribose deacetylase (regulator of RNase III)
VSIEIREGSILDFEGDCVVNPANSFMRHGAGLARIIADAAQSVGYSAQTGKPDPARFAAARAFRAENAAVSLTATGNVAVTSAGVLPFKGIVHAVGPIWNGGAYHEAELLERVVDRALAEALDREWRTIALPAISCGIFGFPVDRAARIMVQEAKRYKDQFDTIAFYPFGYELVFEDALEA